MRASKILSVVFALIILSALIFTLSSCGHTHTFGDWIDYSGNDNTYCENRLFYRICTECSDLEWKGGTADDHSFEVVTTEPTCQNKGYDTNICSICLKVEITNEKEALGHSWKGVYSSDNSYHWLGCEYCDEKISYSQHRMGEDGICTVCSAVTPLGNAKDILFAMYKDTASTAKDYKVVNQIQANGATYPITWTTDKPDNATVVAEYGKVTIKITPSQEADVTYKLTATLKDAEGNEIKVDFTRTIAKMKIFTPDTEISIKDAIELGLAQGHNQYTDGKFYVSGVITEVYNTTYGNMYIEDAEGNKFTIYGTYSADGSARYDAMEVKPVAGDTVTVYGIVGQYNDTAQIKNAWITKHTPAERPDT